MAWIVEHADTMLTIFLRERDGLTPYNRLKGRPRRIARQRLENAWSFAGARDTHRKHAGRQECSWERENSRQSEELTRVPDGTKKELLLSVKGHAVVNERKDGWTCQSFPTRDSCARMTRRDRESTRGFRSSEISGKVRIHARVPGMQRHPTGSPHGRHRTHRRLQVVSRTR